MFEEFSVFKLYYKVCQKVNERLRPYTYLKGK